MRECKSFCCEDKKQIKKKKCDNCGGGGYVLGKTAGIPIMCDHCVATGFSQRRQKSLRCKLNV